MAKQAIGKEHNKEKNIIENKALMKVLFFAQLKERLDCAELDINDPSINTVEKLKTHLSARGLVWQDCLADGRVLVAVNQDMAELETALNSDDEVAFFPPVTGG